MLLGLQKLGSIPAVHHGAVLPVARVIVLVVPVVIFGIYFGVLRRRRPHP